MRLGEKRYEVLAYIYNHYEAHGLPPTVREIGEAVGLASSDSVHFHIDNLVKEGLLKRQPGKPRTYQTTLAGNTQEPNEGALSAGKRGVTHGD